MYLRGRPGTEVRAEAGVEVQETAEVGTKIPLLLVGASPALRQVRGPAI